MPDFWALFCFGKPWVDLFHIAHTHLLGGVDVPFFKFDLPYWLNIGHN